MKRWRIEIKETRTHVVILETDDVAPDEAYQIAEDQWPEGSISDQFDSFERHSITELTNGETA